MRIVTSSLLAAALAAPLAPTGAQAGPNVPLCIAIQNNYNNCLVQQNRRAGVYGGGYGRGYGGGYGGYGGGWGGGWGDDDEGGYYGGGQRNSARAAQAQQACMGWIAQLKANNCF